MFWIILPSFVLPSQPVLWVSSSQAQEDNAQAVRDSATLPLRVLRCVRVALDSYVPNRTLPKLCALVSMDTTALLQKTHMRIWRHSLVCSLSLPSRALLHSAVSLFLWCHLARLLLICFVSFLPVLVIEMHVFCDRLLWWWGVGLFFQS